MQPVSPAINNTNPGPCEKETMTSSTKDFSSQFSTAWENLKKISSTREIVLTRPATEAIATLGFKGYIEELRKNDLRDRIRNHLLSELGLMKKRLEKLHAAVPPHMMEAFEKLLEEEVEKRLEAYLQAEKSNGMQLKSPDEGSLTGFQLQELAYRREQLRQCVALLDKKYLDA